MNPVSGTTDFIVELGTRSGRLVTRQVLTHPFGADPVDPRIGDAMARLSGATFSPVSDVFTAGDDLVIGTLATPSVFQDAFADYHILSSLEAPGLTTPVAHLASFNEPLLQHLADKWNSSVVWSGTGGLPAPNHQLLIIGDTNGTSPIDATGLTVSRVPGESSSFVFRGAIEERAHRSDVEPWAMKTAAHELAHQWKTTVCSRETITALPIRPSTTTPRSIASSETFIQRRQKRSARTGSRVSISFLLLATGIPSISESAAIAIRFCLEGRAMKTNSVAAIVFLIAASLVAQQKQPTPSVVATLNLPAPSVLPGVPFDIIVTLKNVSSHPAAAGLVAQLHVTLADGTEFVPRDRCILEPNVAASPETSVDLSPGETRQYAVTWQYADPPNWSASPEFTDPGVYRLSLVLEDTQEPLDDYAGAIRSDRVELRRTVSPGEDEELWKRMRTVSDGPWSDDGFTRLKSGRALLDEILKLHPASQYYPYAVLLRAPAHEKSDITRALEAAPRFRQSPAYPHLLKYAADGAMSQALKADWRGDAKERDEYYAAADKYYGTVLDEVTNVALRTDAQNRRHIAHNHGRPAP